MAQDRAKVGDTMHRYWLWSSIVVHVWLILGAAALTSGVYLPNGYMFAIFGFKLSHIGRLLALDHMDKAASTAEALGIFVLVATTLFSIHDDPWWVSAWFIPLVLERMTHLPTAWRCDAEWMRSYDLWDGKLVDIQDLNQENPVTGRISRSRKNTAESLESFIKI